MSPGFNYMNRGQKYSALSPPPPPQHTHTYRQFYAALKDVSEPNVIQLLLRPETIIIITIKDNIIDEI